ncbi:MAG: hypothetical protein ACTSWK_17745, partial [Promethearchaeota archaeon]
MLFKSKVNPFTSELQKIFNGTLVTIKSSVDTYNNLPISGNTTGDGRITSDTGHLYIWLNTLASGSLSDWDDQGDIV